MGQGAIGIETRVDDPETRRIVEALNHAETRTAVSAERAFLRQLEGGCQVPIAAHAVVSGAAVALTGLVASIDGRIVIRERMDGPAGAPEDLGVSLAERILEQGGREILDAVYQAAGPGRTRVVPSPLAGDSHTKIPSPLRREGQGGGV
ncbi:MAG: hypothetical protein A2V83_06950 [Nitrospirae bacterium RBG_16_64_22]|nr:MAG: hypothetical protein A2V83_06950 [Nitrospirae bacterium RBG_16_64_22]